MFNQGPDFQFISKVKILRVDSIAKKKHKRSVQPQTQQSDEICLFSVIFFSVQCKNMELKLKNMVY